MKRRIFKVDNDKFYTSDIIANQLIDTVKSQIWYHSIKHIIEPSAGSGAFSKKLNCIAYDLYPEDPSIIQADYLKLDIPHQPNTLIIGNPPFGKQASLAFKFIRKSFQISDYIAFILPLSFNKISFQNLVPLTHSLDYQLTLPKNSFVLPDGTAFDVPCVFQIWIKKEREKVITHKTCQYFEFVKEDKADLAIRRVGRRAGILKEEYKGLSKLSHYFIRLNMDRNKFIRIYNTISWKHLSEQAMGPKSLSKHEIITEFLKHMNQNVI